MPNRRRSNARKIDFTHWAGSSGSVFALSAGTSGLQMFPAAHEPETILRMRGEAVAFLDGSSAPGVLILVSMGLILVPEGTGTTVTWSPFTDSDAPWFWYESFHIGHEEAVIDVVGLQGIGFARRVIDSKSMRITRNQEVQLVVENTTLGAAQAINAAAFVRGLSGT